MLAHLEEWLNLLLRWFHVIAGISWIGSSFYFMWLDATITPPDPPRPDVKADLWMVHSGGFYRVEKRIIGPGKLPPVLHWFKWEAALTWMSGLSLLVVVYYLGGGIYLLDPSVSRIGLGAATALGLGGLVVGWLVYDVLWSSALGKRPIVAAAISFVLVAAVAYGLSRTLSGRAAFIHVGALFGTLMVANVWMRILPAQRQMIAATNEGRAPDMTLGARAKQRSVHNNYMTFPVIFIMVSNHFPSTYAHEARWAVLGALILAGAGVRHFMNVHSRAGVASLVAASAAVVALFFVTAPPSSADGGAGIAVVTASPGAATAAPRTPIDPAKAGAIHSVVRLAGTPPLAETLSLPGACAAAHSGPVLSNSVLAKDGLLQNVFVYLGAGAERWAAPPAPSAEVVVDQKGCLYAPRVIGAMVGQPITFVNSDPFLHNVNVAAKTRAPYNLSMPGVGMRLTRKFGAPEVMVHVKCDVHPWMAAWIGVVPHPWYAVSTATGEVTIPGVPPGDYVLEAWHEVFGTRSVEVTVGPSATAETSFTFEATRAP